MLLIARRLSRLCGCLNPQITVTSLLVTVLGDTLTPFRTLVARGRSRDITSGYVRPSAMPLAIARVSPARPFNIPFVSRVSLVPVEDRRVYHPLGPARSVRVLSGHAVQPLVVQRRGRLSRPKRGLPVSLQFAVPKKTIVCVRRKRRREVLFAKRKAHGGSGRRRRNIWSNVICHSR